MHLQAAIFFIALVNSYECCIYPCQETDNRWDTSTCNHSAMLVFRREEIVIPVVLMPHKWTACVCFFHHKFCNGSDILRHQAATAKNMQLSFGGRPRLMLTYMFHRASDFFTSTDHPSNVFSRVIPQTHPAAPAMSVVHAVRVLQDLTVAF